MFINSSIFKAYDIRGIYPDELNEDVIYQIGKAFVEFVKPKNVVIGYDIRLSSPSLFKALSQGIMDMGVDVVALGEVSTDMVYFANAWLGCDSGIMLTASHNPPQYNGMKMVREQSIPISGDTGIYEIRDLAIKQEFTLSDKKGTLTSRDIYDEYVKHVRSFINPEVLKPYKIVADAGNGVGGKVASGIVKGLPVEIISMNFEPDGRFPNGEPNPLLEENRIGIIEKVKQEKADIGVAWDGDADRCFFIDENGEFIDGYYITALLAEAFLKKKPGAKIIFDPRLIWANIDVVKQYDGISLINKSGHAFIKERMRTEDALFAGEMSGHYYFKDNYYADNGMIPLVLILELMSITNKSLAELLLPLKSRYFISGEINCVVDSPAEKIKEIEEYYKDGAITRIDGLSVEYQEWRFNLRSSNTEPLIRLNVEAKNKGLLEEKTGELRNRLG